ncbi:prolyl oligopeptidase family serine peptidase [Brevundimonas fluminis]|jgi:dipeptidyl aminopeptidase/acylaminoacyl peptidase|uniref:S9 family peptidase n=1 Tax=Brevundimonas fluminis TaxID=2487274 RepID=UPI000F657672|nr:prolyl oligopeptidase family serine peptidase [Brevundimonas fluminis]
MSETPRRRVGPVATRRQMIVGTAALGLVAGAGPAWARRAAYPIEAFFRPERTVGVALSPNGKRLAALEQIGTPAAPHGVIDVVDADDPEGPRGRIDIGPLDVQSVAWANDARLLVRVLIKTTVTGRAPTGSNIRSDDLELTQRRVLSLDVEGASPPVVLFQDQRRRMRQNFDLGRIVDMLPAEPNHVLMTSRENDGVLGLHKVDVRDGSAVRIERGQSGTYAWRTQAGVPVLRHDINSRGNMETVYGRAPGEREWKFLRRNWVADAPDFSWVTETDRPGVVLVTARQDGEDVESLRELDLHTLTFGPPLQSREGRDVLAGVTDSAGRHIGAAFYGDRLEYDFVEDGLAAHHRALDRFFDGACDVQIQAVDAARNRFLALATGPREPGSWWLYDRAARSITNIGWRRDLEPERLGDAEVLEVATRDGARIEAYLTAPPGAAPGPLIVRAHGGPEVRDHRGWDRQAQVLAAQGWWVLQPNFRGSGGYGRSFAQQGWKRWGERMQHDVEDAVAHAVAARGLDGARVGIMGTSYGGYAALMGAVLRPDLYKAAVGICGVYDLPDIMEWEKRLDDTPGAQIVEFWTQRIGDPRADGAMLEAASPRRRAAEVSCPVILVHGAEDGVVPVAQSHRMRDALRAARKTVDYVEIPDFGHADWEAEQELALMRRYVDLFRTAFA